MNKFIPFKDDSSALVFTDTKGNEFNVENGTDTIKVFGQLEGEVQSDNFTNIVNLFNNILKSTEQFGTGDTVKAKALKSTIKDSKFKLDIDLEIGANASGHALTQEIVAKLKSK